MSPLASSSMHLPQKGSCNKDTTCVFHSDKNNQDDDKRKTRRESISTTIAPHVAERTFRKKREETPCSTQNIKVRNLKLSTQDEANGQVRDTNPTR